MADAKAKTGKSVVAITRGGRWEAKKIIREGQLHRGRGTR